MKPIYDITEVVPHSKTMCLLDTLISYDESSTVAQVHITNGSCFATDKGVPSWIGIEYMAQTIAAYGGATNLDKGQDVNIGFLVGTRKYNCHQPYFALNEMLTIEVVKELEGDNGLNTFSCKIIVKDADGTEDIKATANINVYQPQDVEAFLHAEE